MSSTSKRPLAEQLRRERSRIIATLMEREPDLTQRLTEIDSALEHLPAGLEENAYSEHRSALDAVIAYLQHAKRYSSSSEIIDTLIAGGYATSDPNRRANIRDTFFYHTTKSKRLVRRESDGFIGLPEWAENKPSQPQSQSQS